jgi:hypothetical protein
MPIGAAMVRYRRSSTFCIARRDFCEGHFCERLCTGMEKGVLIRNGAQPVPENLSRHP